MEHNSLLGGRHQPAGGSISSKTPASASWWGMILKYQPAGGIMICWKTPACWYFLSVWPLPDGLAGGASLCLGMVCIASAKGSCTAEFKLRCRWSAWICCIVLIHSHWTIFMFGSRVACFQFSLVRLELWSVVEVSYKGTLFLFRILV